MKTCKHCDVILTAEVWCKSRREKHDYVCRHCAREKRAMWVAANPERAAEIVKKAKDKFVAQPGYLERTNQKSKEWRKSNPEKTLLIHAKSRAKTKGIPFELSATDVHIPEFCPVLGIPLTYGSKGEPGLPSLDRIIPQKGYVLGNVAVISYRANMLKNQSSLDELKKLVAWLEDVSPPE